MAGVLTLEDQQGLETIDLLKIDAERSELDALVGIADGDWPKVRQLVIEVHDAGIRDRVVEILGVRGFAVEVEQDVFLEGTELYNVYARRPEGAVNGGSEEVPAVWSSPSRLIERQVRQVDQDEMAAMLDELRGLSPEEIKALLEAEG